MWLAAHGRDTGDFFDTVPALRPFSTQAVKRAA
jgi:hypothetical protein